MNKKNNKQFQDSAVCMEQALLELMGKMPFKKITVRQICERAGVNRSTFYVHYTNIDNMIEQMEANLQQELMDNYPASENIAPLSIESLIPFLEFIRDHKGFYQIALKARQDFPLKQGFEPMWNQVIKPLCLKAGIASENEMLLYFVGFQAGFTMILKHWVDHGCPESPETIAHIIQNTSPSIWPKA